MVSGSTERDGPLRIAHFGTFDVENYGDLLFPLILERRMADRGQVVTHVSPVGGAPVCLDAVASMSTQEALGREFDGFVIGGGHLIHGQPSDVAVYRAAGDRGLFAYADLWLGASLRASELGIPIVWNAPGVPGPFPSETGLLARWAADRADYLSVRDETSRSFLAQTGFDGEIAVVLDSALEVAQLWSRAALDAAWREAFLSRGQPVPERALAVHFNTRFLKDGVEATARRLDALARQWKLRPVLLALGPCHGDSALQSDVSQAMSEPHCLIDSLRSLREIAACIRGSLLYVGSSLHGGVTARAFDRPAILVAQEAIGGHAKHRSFLEAHRAAFDSAAGRASAHVASWGDAWERADQILAGLDRDEMRPSSSDLPTSAMQNPHWNRLLTTLEASSPGTRKRRRQAFERFDALLAARWRRESAYVGILVDQAGEAASFRETAQRNAQRFRRLERIHLDLKQTIAGDRGARAEAGSPHRAGKER